MCQRLIIYADWLIDALKLLLDLDFQKLHLLEIVFRGDAPDYEPEEYRHVDDHLTPFNLFSSCDPPAQRLLRIGGKKRTACPDVLPSLDNLTHIATLSVNVRWAGNAFFEALNALGQLIHLDWWDIDPPHYPSRSATIGVGPCARWPSK